MEHDQIIIYFFISGVTAPQIAMGFATIAEKSGGLVTDACILFNLTTFPKSLQKYMLKMAHKGSKYLRNRKIWLKLINSIFVHLYS